MKNGETDERWSAAGRLLKEVLSESGNVTDHFCRMVDNGAQDCQSWR